MHVVRAGNSTLAARCLDGVQATHTRCCHGAHAPQKPSRLHIHVHHRAPPEAFGAHQFMMMGIMIATTGVLFIKAEMKPMGMIMRTRAAAVETL